MDRVSLFWSWGIFDASYVQFHHVFLQQFLTLNPALLPRVLFSHSSPLAQRPSQSRILSQTNPSSLTVIKYPFIASISYSVRPHHSISNALGYPTPSSSPPSPDFYASDCYARDTPPTPLSVPTAQAQL